MKKTVYLVRHGESEENAGAPMVGATARLSEKGRDQAQRIAERARRLPIDIIITSTMLRAQQTGQAIAESTGKPIEHSELLVERGMPTNQLGKSQLDPEVMKEEQQLVERLIEHDYRLSDEENFSDLKERGKKALKFLEDRAEQNILVVSHGAFLKILIGEVLFGDDFTGKEAVAIMKKMKTMNTGITVFDYDTEHKYGPWRMMTYNDHAHLG